MGYKVPDWKQSINQDKFDVETEQGTFQLPKAEYLTGHQVQRFAEAETTEGSIYAVLDEVAPGLGTALLDVPLVYVKELVAAWQSDSGISLGESSASATS